MTVIAYITSENVILLCSIYSDFRYLILSENGLRFPVVYGENINTGDSASIGTHCFVLV